MIESISFDQQLLCIEYAKSGRSECKICEKSIEANSIRIGHTIYFDPEHLYVNKRWCHMTCFQLPATFKNVKFYEFEGSDQIKDADRKKVIDYYKIEEGTADLVPKSGIKMKFHPPVTKASSQKAFTDSQFNLYQRYQRELETCSVKELQGMLAKNNMAGSGAKDKLIQKIAECKVLGRRPMHCPECGGTNIRFLIREGEYYCPGYLDDIDWVKCEKTIPMSSIKRERWIE